MYTHADTQPRRLGREWGKLVFADQQPDTRSHVAETRRDLLVTRVVDEAASTRVRALIANTARVHCEDALILADIVRKATHARFQSGFQKKHSVLLSAVR